MKQMILKKPIKSFLKRFLMFTRQIFLLQEKKNNVKINKTKSPWMTDCILKSVRKKKQYKLFLMNPSSKNEPKYKNYKNKLNHIIKVAKKSYYEEQFIKYKKNSRMRWRTMNELLNKQKKNTNISKTFIDASSKTIDDPKEIASKFNEYFINIGPNLANKIECRENDSFEKYLTGNYQSNMFLDPITEDKLEKELKNMRSNKSSGYDGVIIKIIQLASKEISLPLTHIFNLTFTTGTIPDDLKIALVTPVFKGYDEKRFENYRPISVLTSFSKLLERFMVKRLTKFIDQNNVLSKHQYGFRKNIGRQNLL